MAVDAKIEYSVARSGRTVWRSSTVAGMLAAAKAGAFDVLLTGYFDRWQRNSRRTLELVEDHLDPSGVAWVIDLDRGCFAWVLGGPDRRTLFMVVNEWSPEAVDRGPRMGHVLAVDAPAPGIGWP